MSPRSRAAPLGGERRGVTDVVCVLLPTLLALLLALSVAPPPVAASPTEQGVAEKAEAAGQSVSPLYIHSYACTYLQLQCMDEGSLHETSMFEISDRREKNSCFRQTQLIHRRLLNERLKSVLKMFFVWNLAFLGRKYGRSCDSRTNLQRKQFI